MPWSLIFFNTVSEAVWVVGSLYLITTHHPVWAGVFIVGAFFSGYSET